MKTVRLENNIVVEVIPSYALPVKKWYGDAFAARCIEAPEYVEQHWAYNPETDIWAKPETPSTEPIPEPEQLTPAQQRENAYNTQAIIAWDGEMMTVTEASKKWQYYAAEGNTAKTDELMALIAAAKQTIREQYPDA